jgi:hypothetical protein
MMPNIDRKVRERLPFKDFPSLGQLEQKTAIALVNSENAFDSLEPLPPNVIQVAGLQIAKPKELPAVSCKFD